jgi:hypothetical protein
MISPRLRKLLAHSFISCHTAKEIPKPHRVFLSTSIGTPHGSEKDWKALAKKGLIAFEPASSLTRIWGGKYWSVRLLEPGAAELAEDLEREKERAAHVSINRVHA